MAFRPLVIALSCVALLVIFDSLVMPQAKPKRRCVERIHEILKRMKYTREQKCNVTETDDWNATEFELASTVDNKIKRSVRNRATKRPDMPCETLPDFPGTCKYIEDIVYLGESVYPKRVVMRTCSQSPQTPSCPKHYRCQEIYYEIITLKKSWDPFIFSPSEYNSLVPDGLYLTRVSWSPAHKNITVGCECLHTSYWDYH